MDYLGIFMCVRVCVRAFACVFWQVPLTPSGILVASQVLSNDSVTHMNIQCLFMPGLNALCSLKASRTGWFTHVCFGILSLFLCTTFTVTNRKSFLLILNNVNSWQGTNRLK